MDSYRIPATFWELSNFSFRVFALSLEVCCQVADGSGAEVWDEGVPRSLMASSRGIAMWMSSQCGGLVVVLREKARMQMRRRAPRIWTVRFMGGILGVG